MISMFAMLPVTGVKLRFLTAVIFSVLGVAMPGLMGVFMTLVLRSSYANETANNVLELLLYTIHCTCLTTFDVFKYRKLYAIW